MESTDSWYDCCSPLHLAMKSRLRPVHASRPFILMHRPCPGVHVWLIIVTFQNGAFIQIETAY